MFYQVDIYKFFTYKSFFFAFEVLNRLIKGKIKMTNLRGFTSTKIVLTNDAKSLCLYSVFFTEECGLYD